MSADKSSAALSEPVFEATKPIHTILLDTSPILLNTPSISTLLANCHVLVTTESVLNEIRGEEARSRLETLYKPFISLRAPKPDSIKLVREFARRTGDGAVLSDTDFEILALAYDLECEHNGGDWRLRRVPGQKRLNGSPPTKQVGEANEVAKRVETKGATDLEMQLAQATLTDLNETTPGADHTIVKFDAEDESSTTVMPELELPLEQISQLGSTIADIVESEASSESDDGWITPSNIKKHQAKEDAASNKTKSEDKVLQVATMTGDFAMQNVLLQMNLNLLSTRTCKRVAHIKQMIFRCHACFATTKDMTKQFCPRCGGPTLTRVTCTTNDKGEVKLHLKANYRWNNRGNVFSIPKPTSGSANQKWKGPQQGGGQGGWGNGLILAEDQKEYIKAMSSNKKSKSKDLMDEDVLPSILTGDRNLGGGRARVGAGRTVNSRKR